MCDGHVPPLEPWGFEEVGGGEGGVPSDVVWLLGQGGHGFRLCTGAKGQRQLWSGFCPPMGCWRRAEGYCVGHFQFFRGSRFAACCLLARASVLWRKYCRNSLVMPFPGFVSDGAVWLQGCSQKGDFGL